MVVVKGTGRWVTHLPAIHYICHVITCLLPVSGVHLSNLGISPFCPRLPGVLSYLLYRISFLLAFAVEACDACPFQGLRFRI